MNANEIPLVQGRVLFYLPVLEGPAVADFLQLEYGQHCFQAKAIKNHGEFPFSNKIIFLHFSCGFFSWAVHVIDKAANI